MITPWNYPLVAAIGDAAPALMAGNTVVIKPSQIVPLTGDGGRRPGARDRLPADVLLVVTGAVTPARRSSIRST